MKIDVVTLFPELYPGPLGSSVVGRGLKNGILEISATDLRQFARDERGTVDDRPYGGGAGMLLKADILADAVKSLRRKESKVLLTSPRGKVFDQCKAEELSACEHLIIVCGHYEGVDQRFIDRYVDEEISIGDYVLSSGNLAAMVMADAIARLLPGVLGKEESGENDSFSTGLLEYPQYTRPYEFEGESVPEVLTGGDHGRIKAWRDGKAGELTRTRRPDVWKNYLLKYKISEEKR